MWVETWVAKMKKPARPVPARVLKMLMAEEVRFELTDPCESPVFKTGAIDHSATLPKGQHCNGCLRVFKAVLAKKLTLFAM